eukprot:TRINITY_DN430_c3_g1_i1.p1 TRINITY_DN430_c3_g1~~TRINITY_DN430_c3_g1_i1.p1  ORF type:complete len:630 (+),score=217.78 TRINITY_DN430_c3_g1_i1:257-1891(+)
MSLPYRLLGLSNNATLDLERVKASEKKTKVNVIGVRLQTPDGERYEAEVADNTSLFDLLVAIEVANDINLTHKVGTDSSGETVYLLPTINFFGTKIGEKRLLHSTTLASMGLTGNELLRLAFEERDAEQVSTSFGMSNAGEMSIESTSTTSTTTTTEKKTTKKQDDQGMDIEETKPKQDKKEIKKEIKKETPKPSESKKGNDSSGPLTTEKVAERLSTRFTESDEEKNADPSPSVSFLDATFAYAELPYDFLGGDSVFKFPRWGRQEEDKTTTTTTTTPSGVVKATPKKTIQKKSVTTKERSGRGTSVSSTSSSDSKSTDESSKSSSSNKIDRNLKVYGPYEEEFDPRKFQVPDSFYTVTAKDAKQLMGIKAQGEKARQKDQLLMTKAMRREMEMREKNKYKKTQIRVLFPDRNQLEATFGSREKLSTLYDIVKASLATPDKEFYLYISPPVQKLTDQSMSLLDLDLIPAANVRFAWADKDNKEGPFLSDEYLDMVEAPPAIEGMEVEFEGTEDDMQIESESESDGKGKGKGKAKSKIPKWLKM